MFILKKFIFIDEAFIYFVVSILFTIYKYLFILRNFLCHSNITIFINQYHAFIIIAVLKIVFFKDQVFLIIMCFVTIIKLFMISINLFTYFFVHFQ